MSGSKALRRRKTRLLAFLPGCHIDAVHTLPIAGIRVTDGHLPGIVFGLSDSFGGARDDYRGTGNLLVGSYPADLSTWVGSGKDHVQSDPANLVVYGIGIAPSSFSFAKSLIERIQLEIK